MSILEHLKTYSEYHEGTFESVDSRHIFTISDPSTLVSLAPIPITQNMKVEAVISYDIQKPTVLEVTFYYDRYHKDDFEEKPEYFFGTYTLRVSKNMTYAHFTKIVFDAFWSLYEAALYYYRSFEE